MKYELIKDLFRLSPASIKEEDLGVEIEVEGQGLIDLDYRWTTTHDDSLRGESREYVLKGPQSLEECAKSLKYLKNKLKQAGSKVVESVRTGVHVHVNVQHLNIIELYNFITLYLILEPLLIKYCGEARDGNLFCLGAKDAWFTVGALSQAAKQKRFREIFRNEDLRYSAVNVNSIPKFGSLEFRSMRTTKDVTDVYPWVELLLHLRNYSKGYENPKDVISSFSGNGTENFLKNVLGPRFEMLSSYDYEPLVHQGMRNAQDLAYCCRWETLASKHSTNPFAKAKKEDNSREVRIRDVYSPI